MKCFWCYLILSFMGITTGAGLAEPAPKSRGLRGSVEDTSGAVIAGAQITVTTQDGKTAAKGNTDNSGNFHFVDLTPGSYSVSVAKDGFREVRRSVKVGPTAHVSLRIVLPVAAVAENITVEASDASAQLSTDIAQN
jgi:hypothetical protein